MEATKTKRKRKSSVHLEVRAFVPDGKGGYVNWDDLNAERQQSERERLIGLVRDSPSLQPMFMAKLKQSETEPSGRVQELLENLA